MTLYFIGLGLYDKKDITIRGLEIIKKCSSVFLEHYTSILHSSIDELEELYGKKLTVADRDMVEREADKIFEEAIDNDVAFLVAGDSMCATTHVDLMLRAKEKGVNVEIVNNASIINAVGVTGLEVYKFGKVTSLVFPDDNWLPETPYEYIKTNQTNGMHTLCLLDIKVREQSKEDMIAERAVYQKPRFMSVSEAIDVMLKIEDKRGEGFFTEQTKVIAIARVGAPDMKIVYGTVAQLRKVDFGSPLHAMIVPAKNLHFMEEDALRLWSV